MGGPDPISSALAMLGIAYCIFAFIGFVFVRWIKEHWKKK